MPFSTKVSKELKEWGMLAVIVGTLYFTGLLPEIAGFAQRLVLYTGLIQPDIEQADTNLPAADYNLILKNLATNESVSLSKSKNRVVFMNFWATWCPPCIAEMPNIQSLYDEMNSEDIDFYLITVDKDLKKAKKFIERKGYTFPVYSVQSTLPNAYSSGSIPTTFVIDKNGRIVMKHTGMADYNTDKFKSFLSAEALRAGGSVPQ